MNNHTSYDERLPEGCRETESVKCTVHDGELQVDGSADRILPEERNNLNDKDKETVVGKAKPAFIGVTLLIQDFNIV